MQKRGKKGQVTVFIILGIIILVVVGILVYFYTSNVRETSLEEVQVRLDASALEPIKELIETCTKETIEKGIILVGMQGGYYNPAQFVQLGNYSVSYAYINGANKLPTLARIGQEIEEYSMSDESREKIDNCINDFKQFTLNIESGDYEVEMGEISGTSIPVRIIYPIEVSKGDITLQIPDVTYLIESGIGVAYAVAVDIVNDEATSGDFKVMDYINSNFPLATIERQRADSNLFYYLESIPQQTEKPFKFHFIIEK